MKFTNHRAPERPAPERTAVEVSTDELGARIVALAGRLAAATSRWLLLVADFDARDGCASFGLDSTAHWLEYSCGLAHRTAVDHVRVARALAAWPQLAAEMAAGRPSYSHVRAIGRISDHAEPQLVDELIMIAEHGTVHQLEVTVRGLRSVADNDAMPGQPDERVTQAWTERSQWRLSARLDPERGAVVASALSAVVQAEGCSADAALVRLAEIALVALADGGQVRALRGDEWTAVIVHLDAARVQPEPAEPIAEPRSAEPDADPSGPTSDRPYARIAGGPGLPDRVVQRLLCSGRIRTVVRDGTGGRLGGRNVLDLGRTHRLVTDHQHRALLLRHDGRCGHPGCRSRRDLQAHHVRHWLHGGATDMANLVLLCPRHHHAHHDGEFTVTALGRGRFRFVRAGRVLADHPGLPPDGAALIEHDHHDVAATAATTRWDGSRLDHDLAVWGLAQHLAGRRSA